MNIDFLRILESDSDDVIRFLTEESWPFHPISDVDHATARKWIDEGRFGSEDIRGFWIVVDKEAVGLLRLMDLTDDTPLFDLRIRAEHRKRGIGAQAVTWLTRYLFEEFPQLRRIEGTTRQDNRPMRQVFLRSGYVKEAHYRDAWPAVDGTFHDSVAYGILRRDWESGTLTQVPWSDEPLD